LGKAKKMPKYFFPYPDTSELSLALSTHQVKKLNKFCYFVPNFGENQGFSRQKKRVSKKIHW